MNGPIGQETRSGSERLPEEARDREHRAEETVGGAVVSPGAAEQRTSDSGSGTPTPERAANRAATDSSVPADGSGPVAESGEPAGSVVRDELDGSPVLREVLGDALEPLTVFHRKLMAEGEPRGIIGPRDVGIVWERHILNSAAVVPFLARAVDGQRFRTVADVGSGGGFPGLVAAACLPDCRFTLIEPMERRVEWLTECVEEMGLENVTILRARSEEVIARMRKDRGMHPFAAVTCRAVAPMTKLAGWTLPLLRSGGSLIALKGRSAQAEIDKASKEISRRGGVHPRVESAPVGPGLEPTHVVIVGRR